MSDRLNDRTEISPAGITTGIKNHGRHYGRDLRDHGEWGRCFSSRPV